MELKEYYVLYLENNIDHDQMYIIITIARISSTNCNSLSDKKAVHKQLKSKLINLESVATCKW